MSQSLAFANGWSLATSLMVCITVFRIGTGNGYAVMPSSEYDGDPAVVVAELDPYDR